MIGIVIVTHSQLGEALIEAAEFIIGSKPEATMAVSIDLKENAEKLRGKIDAAIKKVASARRGAYPHRHVRRHTFQFELFLS